MKNEIIRNIRNTRIEPSQGLGKNIGEEGKFKIIHEETRKRLQEVLTKEQLTKFDEMKKQRHDKWQKKHEALTDQKAPEPTK